MLAAVGVATSNTHNTEWRGSETDAPKQKMTLLGSARRRDASWTFVAITQNTSSFTEGIPGGHARHYLSGLRGTARRKNVGRLSEDMEASNYQGMQQFISDSPWRHDADMEQVAREAAGVLGGHRDTAF